MDELDHLADCFPDVTWRAALDGQIEYANQRWHESTGLWTQRTLGSGWQQTIYPHDVPGFIECWRAPDSEGLSVETEARLRRFDGTYRWFLFRVIAKHDHAGASVEWYGHATDRLAR